MRTRHSTSSKYRRNFYIEWIELNRSWLLKFEGNLIFFVVFLISLSTYHVYVCVYCNCTCTWTGLYTCVYVGNKGLFNFWRIFYQIFWEIKSVIWEQLVCVCLWVVCESRQLWLVNNLLGFTIETISVYVGLDQWKFVWESGETKLILRRFNLIWSKILLWNEPLNHKRKDENWIFMYLYMIHIMRGD